MQNEKIIYVYFNKDNDDILIGKLYIENLRGKEIYSFEYDEKYLSDKKNNIYIDPEIKFYSGRQWKTNNFINNSFGIFSDSAPDRWGRLLLKRKENDIAKLENRNPKTLFDSDYLLGVSDFMRMGAIRFKTDIDGEFVDNSSNAIPPMARLRELENAALAFENEELKEKYEILLSPGSSLGGARPKANVIDENGNIYIAKFPSKNDEYDVGKLEKKVYDLAKKCGLKVVDSNMYSFSKYGSTFLVKRFDREKDKRIHFESAMTLLGKSDGDDATSYLEIASFIKSFGVDIKENLIELFKRIAFNILVKNTDDHLRNHGFLLKNGKWTLSPLYDVNYNKDGKYLHLMINENDSSLDTDILIDTAKFYELSKDAGNKIVKSFREIIIESKLYE
ncbi:MAG: HipA domain-containing protein [Lachnospiraceae bacterium]|nr:HipA domain-containing protein [Lachnospiraceae bacterium]